MYIYDIHFSLIISDSQSQADDTRKVSYELNEVSNGLYIF